MTHRFGSFAAFASTSRSASRRAFSRFSPPGLWLTSRQTLTDRDYQYARCGREMWERPSPLAGYFTSCGNIHDGILAYRLAGLPLTLNLLAQQGLDHFRKPEDRVVQAAQAANSAPGSCATSSPTFCCCCVCHFSLAGCLLGGGPLVGHAPALWQPRRLYRSGALLLLSGHPQRLRRAQP